MPDPDSKRERSPLVIAAAIVVPVLLVLYVLSVGPATWIFVGLKDGPLRSAIIFIYSPLAYLCSICEPIQQVISWYERLWMP